MHSTDAERLDRLEARLNRIIDRLEELLAMPDGPDRLRAALERQSAARDGSAIKA